MSGGAITPWPSPHTSVVAASAAAPPPAAMTAMAMARPTTIVAAPSAIATGVCSTVRDRPAMDAALNPIPIGANASPATMGVAPRPFCKKNVRTTKKPVLEA